MSYPPINIVNSTKYLIYGTVYYLDLYCSGTSEFAIDPNSSYTINDGRGLCLITEIDAEVEVSQKETIKAESYTSSGTSYSQFAVLQTGTNSFEVTRRVSSEEGVDIEEHKKLVEKEPKK